MTSQQKSEDSQRPVKIGIFGSAGVGKSTCTVRFLYNNFIQEYDPTVEQTFSKEIEIDSKKIIINVKDTAGKI
jgi:small GTP-binding protein